MIRRNEMISWAKPTRKASAHCVLAEKKLISYQVRLAGMKLVRSGARVAEINHNHSEHSAAESIE